MPVKNNLAAAVKSYMRAIAKLLALGNWKSNEKNRSNLDCITEKIVGSIAAGFPLGHTPFFEKLGRRIGPERAD